MDNWILETDRLYFRPWNKGDGAGAVALWGDPQVARYIHKDGRFTNDEAQARLSLEIRNMQEHRVSYWPVFSKEEGEFLGCCGLRPYEGQAGVFELGIHLFKAFWGRGIAQEACFAVITHAFSPLAAEALMAGHNPHNLRSKALLEKLGFQFLEEQYYAPTGLLHPTYRLLKSDWETGR